MQEEPLHAHEAPFGPGASGDKALAPVALTSSEFEAQTIAAVLRDAGIDAVVSGLGVAPLSAPLKPKAPRVSVSVRGRDEAAAREVLRRNAEEARAIDWSQVDVGPRADDAPLRPVGAMPLLAKAGAAVCLVLLVIAAAGVLMRLFW